MEWAWGWGINKGWGYPTSVPRFTSISSFQVRRTQNVGAAFSFGHIILLYINFLNVCVSDASRSLPEFPELKDEGKPLPDGLHPQHVHTYQLIYREHCEVSVCAGCQMCGYFSVLVSNMCVCLQAILDVMVNLQFPLVETLWKSFWRFSEGQSSDTDSLDL